MIEVIGLSKYYSDYLALNQLSFQVGKGEVLGFLGPNGAGKTTTIRMLSTYLMPSAGTARIAGYDIVTQAEQAREVLGYLPETPPLYLELTVWEYLWYVAAMRGLSRKQRRIRIEESIERCFLSEVRGCPCRYLSKGFKQRVGLAQAILHDPQVLILDEPTSGLDPRQINDIRKLIRELAAEKTVLMSTHILSEVYATCTKVVIINAGNLVLQESLERFESEESLERLFLEAVSS